METLVNASPATVSRAGIIFVSDTDLDWSPVVEGWILKRPAAEQPVFKELFTRFVACQRESGGEIVVIHKVPLRCKEALTNLCIERCV